jgi:hypothetical protein
MRATGRVTLPCNPLTMLLGRRSVDPTGKAMRNNLLVLSVAIAAGLGSAAAGQSSKNEGKQAAEQQAQAASGGAQTPPAERDARRDAESRRARGRGMPVPPDWPRAGGFGPERPMAEGLAIETIVVGDAIRRELTDADLERVVAVAREVSPEWGETLAARAKESPEQVKEALRGGARRLLALTALKERAPKVFAAKVAELRAQGETARAVAELRRLESDAASTDAALAAARAALDQCAMRQVEATIAARAEELSALEQYIERMRKDLARDGGNAEALAKELAERARERGSRRPDSPEGREGPGGRDGPEGRGGPDGPDGPDGPGGPDGPRGPDDPRGPR